MEALLLSGRECQQHITQRNLYQYYLFGLSSKLEQQPLELTAGMMGFEHLRWWWTSGKGSDLSFKASSTKERPILEDNDDAWDANKGNSMNKDLIYVFPYFASRSSRRFLLINVHKHSVFSSFPAWADPETHVFLYEF